MQLWPLFSLALLWLALPVLAQPAIDTSQPVLMDADRLGYDQENAIVVALGNVRVFQGDSILFAERITYYQQQNIVRADGNVRVEDRAKGETYYAERVQLKDDLKKGVIQNFQVRLADNSQFAAREARRISETKIELDKAVYSPCEICEGKSPFWQIKAAEVEIDDEAQQVTYDDVFLEFYGVPVAYTPYFSHPTPDADAKSGLLRPEYSQSSNLGTTAKLPVYLALAPDKDATITPFLSSEEAPVLIGEYRQRTDNGYYELKGSITYPTRRDDTGAALDERELRGHLFAKGGSRLSDHWHWGFDAQRSTDDTYLRRYDFGAFKSLTSQLFTEGLYGRSYLRADALTFQGLEANDDPDLEPYVLPLLHAHDESEPGLFGIAGLRRISTANLQVITRQEGLQSRRLTLDNGLALPVVTSGGHLFDVTLKARTDIGSVNNLDQPVGDKFSGETARFLPLAALRWRYPVIRAFGSSSLTLEPTVLAIARTSDANKPEIANEDNRIVEFTESNLFRINPFPGYDTVDEGSRVAYGLRGQWLFNSGSNLQFLFGQSYSVEDSTPFPYNDEAGEHFSDYVGRVALDYAPFELSYRYRLDQDSLSPNSSIVSADYRRKPFTLGLDYITVENDAFLSDREEILATMAVALSDEWSVSANARRDLLLNNMLFAGLGLVYQNECFTLATQFSREFTRDRDIEPDDSISVRVSFKNLNEL